MTDSERRALERASVDDPEARAAFGAANQRLGLGWRGEKLATGRNGVLSLDLGEEEPVYSWRVKGSSLDIQFVHVPAGDGVGEFWFGRFPVTWSEYETYLGATHFLPGSRRLIAPSFALLSPQSVWEGKAGQELRRTQLAQHPVVNVTLAAARNFCAWAGLRIPTLAEWRRAAYGSADNLPTCSRCRGGGVLTVGASWASWSNCPDCGGVGRLPERSWPWGSEEPTWRHAVLPSTNPRGAVLCGTDSTRERDERADPADPLRKTGVMVWRPARPDGRSPFGAYDVAGNVFEYVDDVESLSDLRRGRPTVALVGCSWRSDVIRTGVDAKEWSLFFKDDVGFRVALSAGHETAAS